MSGKAWARLSKRPLTQPAVTPYFVRSDLRFLSIPVNGPNKAIVILVCFSSNRIACMIAMMYALLFSCSLTIWITYPGATA